MNLYIIRHGNTHWNTLGKIQGSTDIELDHKGIQEATLLREKVKHLSIDAFISSPLQRAICTAQILNETSLPLEIDDNLTEFHFGEWEGMTWDNVEQQYTTYLSQNTTDGYANPPNGESYEDAYARVRTVTDKIINMPYNNIAIITHRAVIRFIIAYLRKDSLQNINTFQLPNTAIIKMTNGESEKDNVNCKVKNVNLWRFLD